MVKNIILSQDDFVLRFLVTEFTQGFNEMTLEVQTFTHLDLSSAFDPCVRVSGRAWPMIDLHHHTAILQLFCLATLDANFRYAPFVRQEQMKFRLAKTSTRAAHRDEADR